MRVRKKQGGEKRFYFGCRKCDKVLNRRKGVWEARQPNKGTRGYFVPQTICPVISAKYMVDEHKKAKKSPNGMKKFFNYNLGKTYESGEIKINKNTILSKVVPGSIEEGMIAIGADQGDVLHVTVSKITDKRRYIYIGTLDSIPQLIEMIRYYESKNPTIAVLDALPNHNEAQRYSKNIHNLFLCYYEIAGDLEEENLKKKIDEKEIHVSRTDLLDHTAFLWNQGDILIENYINPRNIREFAQQMTNMKRDLVTDNAKGTTRPVWFATGPDHYRHADGYNLLAAKLLGSQSSNELVVASSMDNRNLYTENLFQESDFAIR